jgi:NitT/TauT family transport system substrate-binding protein
VKEAIAVRRARLVGIWLAVLALASCAAETTQETTGTTAEGGTAGQPLTQVTMRLDWIASGEHTEFFVADELGFFAEEGLDVTILEGAGSTSVLGLISAKENDFGLADFGALTRNRAEGVEAVMVMNIFRKNPSGILSLESAGINGPEDLVGKTVGAAPGEGPLATFPAYLATADVNPEDVTIVNIDPSAKVAALCSGQVDAIIEFATAEGPPARATCEETVVEQLYSDFGVTAISSGIVVHPDTIAERPDIIASFVRALQRGLEYDKANPEDAAQIVNDRFPQTVPYETGLDQLMVNIAISEPPEGKPYGYMDPDEVGASLDIYETYLGLEDPLPADEYYTNDFTEE